MGGRGGAAHSTTERGTRGTVESGERKRARVRADEAVGYSTTERIQELEFARKVFGTKFIMATPTHGCAYHISCQ